LFALTTVAGAGVYYRALWLAQAGNRVVARLKQCLYAPVLLQESAFLDTQTTGDILSRLSAYRHTSTSCFLYHRSRSAGHKIKFIILHKLKQNSKQKFGDLLVKTLQALIRTSTVVLALTVATTDRGNNLVVCCPASCTDSGGYQYLSSLCSVAGARHELARTRNSHQSPKAQRRP
jgi:hypothetical protein